MDKASAYTLDWDYAADSQIEYKRQVQSLRESHTGTLIIFPP